MLRQAASGPHFILGLARPASTRSSTQTLGRMKSAVRVVSFEVAPCVQTEAQVQASGAYAIVYVVSATKQVAVERAEHELREAGWLLASTGEVSVVTSESFTEGSEGLAHYQQCLIDDIVIVLHSWRQEH